MPRGGDNNSDITVQQLLVLKKPDKSKPKDNKNPDLQTKNY